MIKIFDLKEQYKQFGSIIDKKVLNILSSGSYILGKNVTTFEEKARDYLKSKYTISCNSGTDALVLSLRALGITIRR
jgi:dTDP-4-amino-4,6-dideoxygalactose transaminase